MDETKAMFAAIIERLDVLISSFQSPKEDVQILKEGQERHEQKLQKISDTMDFLVSKSMQHEQEIFLLKKR